MCRIILFNFEDKIIKYWNPLVPILTTYLTRWLHKVFVANRTKSNKIVILITGLRGFSFFLCSFLLYHNRQKTHQNCVYVYTCIYTHMYIWKETELVISNVYPKGMLNFAPWCWVFKISFFPEFLKPKGNWLYSMSDSLNPKTQFFIT